MTYKVIHYEISFNYAKFGHFTFRTEIFEDILYVIKRACNYLLMKELIPELQILFIGFTSLRLEQI